MAGSTRLKVFRTAIGFHDAYVAAPSRKAALAAWGTGKDLFARGAAEQVDDPALAEEPLAHPGRVIKRSRGTTTEQINALAGSAPRKRPAAKKEEAGARPGGSADKSRRKRPKPSRRPLEDAERAAETVGRRHATEREALDRQVEALARKRRLLEKKQHDECAVAERAISAARRAYEQSLLRWEP